MSVPSVSVVIPTKDRPEWLAQAVDSVLASRYDGPLECLVVYDAPQPGELASGPRPSGRSVRALTNARAPGIAGARNTGILDATGDLVAFCDDDDAWAPDKLGRQVEALARWPQAVLCTTGIEVRRPTGSTLRPAPREQHDLDMLLEDRVMELHPSSFLWRRSALLEDVGLVDETLPGGYAEDYDMLLRAARLAPVVSVVDPLVVVNWHGGSYYFSRWQTIVEALERLLEKHPFDRSPKGRARVHAQIAFAHAAMRHRRSAVRHAARALRGNLREPRAAAALLAASGLVTADRIQRLAHARGRGI